MKNGPKPRHRTDDNTVTFRLRPDEFLELVQRADMLKISRHRLSQQYVAQALAVEYVYSDLVNTIRDLATMINELRADAAISVEMLLLASGLYTEVEARAWVKSQFKIRIPDVETTETQDIHKTT